jgi:hypothetical protein
MAYEAFLQILTQLAGQRRARVVVREHTVFVEEGGRVLSSSVFRGEGGVPPTIREALSGRGVLRWQSAGTHLRLDRETDSVWLFQEEAETSLRYVPWKRRLEAFAQLVEEWKRVLDDLADRDRIFSRKY